MTVGGRFKDHRQRAIAFSYNTWQNYHTKNCHKRHNEMSLAYLKLSCTIKARKYYTIVYDSFLTYYSLFTRLQQYVLHTYYAKDLKRESDCQF